MAGRSTAPPSGLDPEGPLTGNSTTLPPCSAASFTSRWTRLRFSALTADTCSWITAKRNSRGARRERIHPPREHGRFKTRRRLSHLRFKGRLVQFILTRHCFCQSGHWCLGVLLLLQHRERQSGHVTWSRASPAFKIKARYSFLALLIVKTLNRTSHSVKSICKGTTSFSFPSDWVLTHTNPLMRRV